MENGLEESKTGAEEFVMRLHSHALVKVRSFLLLWLQMLVFFKIYTYFLFNLKVRGQGESKEFGEISLVFQCA